MPYKDKAKQREYQRQFVAQRRQKWLEDKICVRCGSTDQLEIDHIDPKTKISHRIWSWSDEKRSEELAKCQVLCKACHQLKSRKEMAKLSPEDVRFIRNSSDGYLKLSRKFGVARIQIRRVKNNQRWTDV